MTRIAWEQRGIRAYRRSETSSIDVSAFNTGTVLLATEAPGTSSNHHLSPAGARALAEALNHAATVAEMESAEVPA